MSPGHEELDPLLGQQILVAQQRTPLFIEPGSPWENGYVESFNARLRDEFLDGEIFYTLTEVRVLTERWRWHFNHVRPHQSLGYRPLTPEARGWPLAANHEDKQPTIH